MIINKDSAIGTFHQEHA